MSTDMFYLNKNTLASLSTIIYKNHGSYFGVAYKKQLCCLGMQNKIVFSSISFGLAHQCSVLHSFEQRQKRYFLIYIYFCRAHRARIFVINNFVL